MDEGFEVLTAAGICVGKGGNIQRIITEINGLFKKYISWEIADARKYRRGAGMGECRSQAWKLAGPALLSGWGGHFEG